MEIFAEDILPVGDLKRRSTELLKRVQNTRRPILLTQNGKPAAVLIDVKEFAETLASKRLARILKKAEKEMMNGEGREIDEFFVDFAARHGL